MENLDENLDQTPKSMKEKRGSFLLVLCILSFITIGFGAISVLTNYLRGPESLIESLEAFDIVEEENVFGDGILSDVMSGSKEVIEKTIENFYEIQMYSLVCYLIGFLGVFMMFKLKKTGFALYVMYNIGLIAIQFIFLGNGPLILMSSIFGIIFSLAFIIMYAVNLNRMTE